MRESSRGAEPRTPLSAMIATVLFLLVGAILIAFFALPVSPATRGFGVGPTPTLAAPLPPLQ